MKLLLILQVVLSFALPCAIIPLMLFTSNKDIMGEFSNTTKVKIVGWAITSMIILLNTTLLVMTFMQIA